MQDVVLTPYIDAFTRKRYVGVFIRHNDTFCLLSCVFESLISIFVPAKRTRKAHRRNQMSLLQKM